MAGGEPRLGTASIYMGNIIAMAPAVCNQNPPYYMATFPKLLNQFRHHIQSLDGAERGKLRLIIGVADGGTPVGVEKDGFADEDKMSLHLINLLKDRIGAQHSINVQPRFDDHNGVR